MIRGAITTREPGPRATRTRRVWDALQRAGFVGVSLWFETHDGSARMGGWYFTADGVRESRWLGHDAEHACEAVTHA